MNQRKQRLKSIVGKTLLFVVIMLFVGVFQGVLGRENTTIGVMTITLSLVFLSRDFMKNPWKNFLLLLLFNILLALGSYLYYTNLWLGFLANAIILGGIGYVFHYSIKKPLNTIVGLGYILLLGNPITAQALPKRILAEIISACIIMGVQVLANRKNFERSSKKKIEELKGLLVDKIENLKNKNATTQTDSAISISLQQFKMLVFESGQTNQRFRKDSVFLLDIISCIERILVSMDAIQTYTKNQEAIDFCCKTLQLVQEDTFCLADTEQELKRFASSDDYYILTGFVRAISSFERTIKKFKDRKEGKSVATEETVIPKEFTTMYVRNKDFKDMNARAAYAIRLGLLVAGTGLITQLFDFEFGKWMVFTVFTLTQPYAEFSVTKTKKRVFGTVIGCVILLILFTFIKDPSLRMVVLLIAGYFNSFAQDYKYIAIIVTVCAICSDALNIPNATPIILARLLFVLIGVVISLLANKYVLKRTYKDEENRLLSMGEEAANKMLKEVLASDTPNPNTIRMLYLVPALIENRFQVLHMEYNPKKIQWISYFINSIYQLYLFGDDNYKQVMHQINRIVCETTSLQDIFNKLGEYAAETEGVLESSLVQAVKQVIHVVQQSK